MIIISSASFLPTSQSHQRVGWCVCVFTQLQQTSHPSQHSLCCRVRSCRCHTSVSSPSDVRQTNKLATLNHSSDSCRANRPGTDRETGPLWAPSAIFSHFPPTTLQYERTQSSSVFYRTYFADLHNILFACPCLLPPSSKFRSFAVSLFGTHLITKPRTFFAVMSNTCNNPLPDGFIDELLDQLPGSIRHHLVNCLGDQTLNSNSLRCHPTHTSKMNGADESQQTVQNNPQNWLQLSIFSNITRAGKQFLSKF